jgi:hypothetical protein
MQVFRFIVLGLFINQCFSLVGQDENDSIDVKSRHRPGVMWYYTGVKPAQTEKVRKYDRLIVDLVHSTFQPKPKSIPFYLGSIGVSTNLLFDVPLTKGNTVSLGIGFNHSYFKIRHNKILVRNIPQRTTTLKEKDSTFQFSKNTLCGNSFSIPIELRFRNPSWRHFKLHLGGKVGVQANLFSRRVLYPHFERQIIKSYYFPDIQRFFYSAHLRLGFKTWALYGNYQITPLFYNKKSTPIHLFQVGLSVSIF